MDINSFFDQINAKSWRKNIFSEANFKVDQLLDYLQEHKSEIVEAIVESCQQMEKLKVEENEQFNYEHFKKWLDYYTKHTIKSFTDELIG